MPFPEASRAARAMTSSLFGELGPRIQCFRDELLALHVGDTWLRPVAGSLMEDLASEAYPDLHRYAAPAASSPSSTAVTSCARS